MIRLEFSICWLLTYTKGNNFDGNVSDPID